MAKRPRMMWIPGNVIAEIEDIKRENNIKSNSEALRSMVKYTQVGREAERLYTFNWSRRKR